ncbi:2-phospho-L-lactate guanylyltransferase [Streptomyces tateyamensis]|uniref:Phosphoenolpyruvate guanylyltransferase n=1 Tax=Streptomyces tateyamensis TaxID=565073 RepID=A0A2V4N5A1_9ACTN|nr:2-phospho-L-lactate guanylyltransferase [Streptomyces tateyamensis]PYC79111.1 2-phospho-L-lactate guanylyltransferase [Streptomyces tateyamensis]
MTQHTVRPPRDAWSLVLPVKPLDRAKSRLAPFAGARRGELALAFALDTVAAALASPLVAQVLVVSQDPRASERLAALGAVVVADEPGGGLNPALSHGAAHARRLRPGTPLAALSADLPALRPAELTRVLAAAAGAGRAFLADAPGAGTTLLACDGHRLLAPAFGGASRARHAAGGARELTLADVPSVRRDVDTGADLAAALALGVGPHTRAAAAALV